jgi:Uma2 family endonuclease
MTIANPIKYRWTSDEYHRMADVGIFRDQRVELIGGEVMDMAPQRDIHAAAVSLAFRAIWGVMGDGFWVRCQLPFRIGQSSEPEPDVSVVPGSERDYIGTGHPTKALLVIEVSDSSLDFDRSDKASLYASAGIAEYWIVNLIDRQVEVNRSPNADTAARFGFSYAERRVFAAGDQIKPLSANGDIAVSDLLP